MLARVNSFEMINSDMSTRLHNKSEIIYNQQSITKKFTKKIISKCHSKFIYTLLLHIIMQVTKKNTSKKNDNNK